MNALLDLDQRLERLADDSSRLASCVEAGDLTAPIAACPGWDLRQLCLHTGGVHRWATHAVQHGASPDKPISMPSDDADHEELGAWMRLGAGVLVDVLATTPLDADTWHPFPFDQKAWVWSRRQMIETALHRWDAEVATTGGSDLDPMLASEGVDEFFQLGLPRIFARTGEAVPTASLHVHCTDEGMPDGSGEWIAWNESGEMRTAPEHRKGDAAVRGAAADILLVFMGRADAGGLDIVGDPAAAAAWLELPGW